MKTFNKYFLLSGVALMGMLTSCEDYLTIYPTNSITKESFWNTTNDVNNVRASAYYQMTQVTDKLVTWGEFRSDNVVVNDMTKEDYRNLKNGVLQPTSTMFDWAALYKGINYCNDVIENGDAMVNAGTDPSFTQSTWQPIRSEMIAQRALYYFYLVRAYRNVPYVTTVVSTDADAKASRISASSGTVILDSLISSVEGALPRAAINYGNNRDNKGRWNRLSMKALLSDMYLWKACLTNKASAKASALGDKSFYATYTAADSLAGDTLKTAAAEKVLVVAALQKSHDYAAEVIKEMKAEYDRRLSQQINVSAELRNQPFPLIRNEVTQSSSDRAYTEVFVDKNSTESIFELQYDGSSVRNTMLSTMFYGDHSGAFTAGIMAANPALFTKNESETDPVKGYGRTDYRYLSYGYRPSLSLSTSPIVKGVLSSMSIEDPSNMLSGYSGTVNFFSNSSQSASWQVYRLADVMMIQAEAIARLRDQGVSTYPESRAYHLVNNLFARNNPGCDSTNTTARTYIARLNSGVTNATRYAAYGNNLLRLVYSERQREFLGEGKRWFDLVRECEYRGATKDVLSEWAGETTTVRNRLRSIWSLYNPIYSEELKVNGRNYGDKQGKLVQNPVWEKYMTE